LSRHRLLRHCFGEDRLVEAWGMTVLAVDDKKSVSRPDKPARSATIGNKANKGVLRDVSVGGALRSVYDETVNEDVPPEFMDLLRKLT
jgi:hypothetical protein